MTEECCKVIWGSSGFRRHKCQNQAKFEVDGKHYCGIHNPNKGPTKAQIQAEFDRQDRMKRRRLEAAAPDLLDALIMLTKAFDEYVYTHDDASPWLEIAVAKQAIAKATGGME